MNLPLSDPTLLAQDIPEILTARLRSSGQAVCIRFSHRGDLLASGTTKGTIAIFDLETNGVARKLKGHTAGRAIQSLSWDKSGRYLLSSSIDWKIVLWDLQDGSRLHTVNLGAPVYIAQLHPSGISQCVAALYEYRPVLVDFSTKQAKQHPLPNSPKRAAHEDGSDKPDAKLFTTVAVFTPSGSHIITGTTKGWLNVIHTATREVVYSTRLCAKPILLIRLSSSGRDLLVNASDTIIRTIKLPDFSNPNLQPDSINLEVEHKFQDVVNRLSWNHVSFSSTADYVMASTLMNHDIYIWERGHGSLVKILEGPKEELGAVEWHPTRPFVAACGVESGKIHIWGINTPQRWSALAPDFAEVEENEEYIEREDEFDIQPDEEIRQRMLDQEDEEVDVLSVDIGQLEREGVMKGSAEAEVFRMPVLVGADESDSEDEMVAIGTGQFRRKSTAREDSEFLEGEDGEGVAAAGTKRRRELTVARGVIEIQSSAEESGNEDPNAPSPYDTASQQPLFPPRPDIETDNFDAQPTDSEIARRAAVRAASMDASTKWHNGNALGKGAYGVVFAAYKLDKNQLIRDIAAVKDVYMRRHHLSDAIKSRVESIEEGDPQFDESSRNGSKTPQTPASCYTKAPLQPPRNHGERSYTAISSPETC
nr:hypothetical protein B0A51_14592 [Rachicladosporium sp. CCFEE 5018]